MPSSTMFIRLTTSRPEGCFDFIELEAELNLLKLLQDIQFRITAERSLLSPEAVREDMINNTSYDASEVAKAGFATAIFEHSGS